MTTFRHNALTHVGRVRKVNEDAILALPAQKIWVVADGMGGYAAGDFASQTITDEVAKLPVDLPPGDSMRRLRNALVSAHDLIRQEAARRGGATIGAAVVTLMMADGHFVAFWAGDSRLYRLRGGAIELLTSDHSLVGALVAAGQLSWDEADQHPQANAITRAVGVGETLELDKIRGGIEPGDRFLLCSDGLNKYAGFEALRRILAATPIETVSEALRDFALTAGGGDNISVIVVDVI